jgi:hypothetical protein
MKTLCLSNNEGEQSAQIFLLAGVVEKNLTLKIPSNIAVKNHQCFSKLFSAEP